MTSDSPIRVLVIDDEPQIRRLLRITLSAQNYQVGEATTGGEGITQAASLSPDVILLDLGLPDMDGLAVIERVREWSEARIIVLSVRDHEDQKIAALDRGADDYVTKPFGMGELLARIRAALRHRVQAETVSPVFQSGNLIVDLQRRLVTVDGQEVRFTPKEYELLRTLVVHAGKVLTHRQLLRQVWGPGYTQETHYLRIYVGQLRQKIEVDPARPHHIITEPGVGYRLRYAGD